MDSLYADLLTIEEYRGLQELGLVQASSEDPWVKEHAGGAWQDLMDSVLVSIEGDTLRCHSGLFADHIPFDLYGTNIFAEKPEVEDSQKIKIWIDAVNAQYRKILEDAKAITLKRLHEETNNTSPGFYGLIPKDCPENASLEEQQEHAILKKAYELGIVAKNQLTSNNFTINFDKKTLTNEQVALLRAGGVTKINHGHQSLVCESCVIYNNNGIACYAGDASQVKTGVKAFDDQTAKDNSFGLFITLKDKDNTILESYYLGAFSDDRLKGLNLPPEERYFTRDLLDPITHKIQLYTTQDVFCPYTAVVRLLDKDMQPTDRHVAFTHQLPTPTSAFITMKSCCITTYQELELMYEKTQREKQSLLSSNKGQDPLGTNRYIILPQPSESASGRMEMGKSEENLNAANTQKFDNTP